MKVNQGSTWYSVISPMHYGKSARSVPTEQKNIPTGGGSQLTTVSNDTVMLYYATTSGGNKGSYVTASPISSIYPTLYGTHWLFLSLHSIKNALTLQLDGTQSGRHTPNYRPYVNPNDWIDKADKIGDRATDYYNRQIKKE